LNNQILNQKRKIENLSSRSAAAGGKRPAPNPPPAPGAGGQRRQRTPNPNNYPKHDFCGRFHPENKCYWDPNSAAYNSQAAIDWRTSNPGLKPGTIPSISTTDAHTDVVTVSHLPEMDVELSALNFGESNISHTTILDGGSDSNIFNFYYLHLFTRLEPHRGSLSGIGGPVANIITHKGIVEFLGVHLVAYYSHNISKSVVSEGVLANNNFSINK
jgi:hypothetical protein